MHIDDRIDDYADAAARDIRDKDMEIQIKNTSGYAMTISEACSATIIRKHCYQAQLAAAEKMKRECITELDDERDRQDDAGNSGRVRTVERCIGILELLDPATVVGSGEPTCVWTYTPTEIKRDAVTGCGHSIDAVDEFPPYCCYCGKRIEVKDDN